MDQCPGGAGAGPDCVVTVHVNTYGPPMTNKKLTITTGGVKQALTRAADDPTHQRAGNFRSREELAKSFL